VELVSGPWRVTSVRRNGGGQQPWEYLRVSYRGLRVADVRTAREVANVLGEFGIALPDLVEHDRSLLR
jgi:hypothetical protein